ncbi:hypothetical protein FOA52_014709, partial [Chlamydomonas sp. UWO 241]
MVLNATLNGSGSAGATLDLVGIQLRPGAGLVLTDVQLSLSCEDWNALQDAVCTGSVSGDSQAILDDLSFLNLSAGGTVWSGVTSRKTPVCGSAAAGTPGPCATRAVAVGEAGGLVGAIERAVTYVVNALPAGLNTPSIALLLEPGQRYSWAGDGAAEIEAGSAPLLLEFDLMVCPLPTLSGNSSSSSVSVSADGDPPMVDMGVRSHLVKTWLSGSLLLRSVTLANLPNQPHEYPLGLLTALMWFVDLSGRNSPQQLTLDRVTMLLPPQE